MLIITTVYIAEGESPRNNEPEKNRREAADLKEAVRHCISMYEGKNRVLPIDLD